MVLHAEIYSKAKAPIYASFWLACQLSLFVLGACHISIHRFHVALVSHYDQLVAIIPMSLAHPQNTASSSSQFQQIFNSALKAYEKRTKKDLLFHPLAAQLQACDSPDAILAVLQNHLNEPDRSRNTDDRWSKWLDPTVNVLFAFSATLGEGVGLVCLSIWTDLRHAP